jgi:hypothetical protein
MKKFSLSMLFSVMLVTANGLNCMQQTDSVNSIAQETETIQTETTQPAHPLRRFVITPLQAACSKTQSGIHTAGTKTYNVFSNGCSFIGQKTNNAWTSTKETSKSLRDGFFLLTTRTGSCIKTNSKKCCSTIAEFLSASRTKTVAFLRSIKSKLSR